MITSSNITYSPSEMKPAYIAATEQEKPAWVCDAPHDYGCIDAPRVIAAGSTYSYEFTGKFKGDFTDMPSAIGRSE